jgi:hypothetical protein
MEILGRQLSVGDRCGCDAEKYVYTRYFEIYSELDRVGPALS